MTDRTVFTVDEAVRLGKALGVDWSRVDLEQFRRGLLVELEHGRRNPSTDVTHDDPLMTAKIALAHLEEIPDYYTRLEAMEAEATGVRRGVSAHRLTGEPD
ncbi:MAG: hypothetical protein FJ206_15960 [Gemmatimonadetes bacterium]|nr:hypothetical protein [Gemmatimonadota bacterium]